jgi:hypothetical protein
VSTCPEADAGQQCVTVELVYLYGDNPLFGRMPLVDQFMPDEVRSVSVARINQ